MLAEYVAVLSSLLIWKLTAAPTLSCKIELKPVMAGAGGNASIAIVSCAVAEPAEFVAVSVT